MTSSTHSALQIGRVSFCILIVFLCHAAFDWYANRPQNAGIDVPSGKLTSLSFAPYREGYSPLEEDIPLEEHVDEDLKLLADQTHGIRTYASLGGLQVVPALARKYGLTMIQGGWLSDDPQDNQQEMQGLIASANANPDVVKRVIVGNEVLLRGELPVDRLIEHIRDVKRQVKQPVSYADVWSMYMKHPQLIKEVDFITIHILPYWEDEPIAVEHAGEHLEKIVRQVEHEAQGIAPGKPILIGESGWPSAGRQRGEAAPGVVNAARYIRDMIQVAKQHGFDYNIVEAFNQPWKSNLEGVVGANWGLMSADREPVFPLTGMVYEHPDWLRHFVVINGVWLLAIAAFFRRLLALSLPRNLLFLSFSLLLGVQLVGMADFLWYTSYSSWQRAYAILLTIANALMAVGLLLRGMDVLNNLDSKPGVSLWLRRLYGFFSVLAFYKTMALALNGRYLSFPVEQFAVPVCGILGLAACLWLATGQFRLEQLAFDRLSGQREVGRYDSVVAKALLFAVLAMIVGETQAFMVGRDFILAHPGFFQGLPVALAYALNNQQLLAWLASLLVLAMPLLCRRRRLSP